MTSPQYSTWAIDAPGKDPIRPYQGNPQLGNLETPINSSSLVKAYINNLPAYRPGLTPFLRGLEIGMAHGYFLVGPEVVVGP
ncbi:MAG: photosystem I reaction center subunit XI, partial [Cyanobacteria bacterium J06614_10]